MNLQDVIIVLSRPMESGNVGAVCRAMKNMGLSRLRIVDSEEIMKDDVITSRAVHAADVWENAEHFNDLSLAIEDCSIVIGTTRRRGRYRKRVSMKTHEIGSLLAEHPGPAALVFGNERTGLDVREIEMCNIASHIPANDNFPSLNLSHAVQIYTYEIFQSLSKINNNVKGQWVPIKNKDMESLVKKITDSLKMLGFYKQAERKEQELFFRDIFSRAALTEKEAEYFSNIISKTVHISKKTT